MNENAPAPAPTVVIAAATTTTTTTITEDSKKDDGVQGSTTCWKCPVCLLCDPDCSCPKEDAGGRGGCDLLADSSEKETDTQSEAQQDGKPKGRATCCKCSICTCGSDCSCSKGGGPGCAPCAASIKDTKSITCNNRDSSPPLEAPPRSPEEQQALGKDGREQAPEGKDAQSRKENNNSKQKGGKKRRWGRGKNNRKDSASRVGGGKGQGNAPDVFDEWLGSRLKAWHEGKEVAEGGNVPPEESGVLAEFDFDPSKNEIAFPASLSAFQRRQVHGWAMQLAIFHASSGEDNARHVIISKTGEFQGKILTRGGRTWYQEGLTAPVVKRFALEPGHEEIARPLVAALQSFHDSVHLRETGFTKWLKAVAPGPLDGSDRGQAQEGLDKWPLLEEGEWEYVDTPEQLSSLVEVLESCKEFGFDLEAHNARTYHGLTCLLQISTEEKDYVIDPLAEGMWDCMTILRRPFGNSDILKIGHSIRSCDVPSLFRDFGIVIINVIDTEESVHALGDKHSGLAKVLENAGVKESHDIPRLKQAMQACDWRTRPLSPDKLIYARCDSHYLIPLWRLLRARLLGADTFANRQDASEEKTLHELKRRLHAEHRQQLQLQEKEAYQERRLAGISAMEAGLQAPAGSSGLTVENLAANAQVRSRPRSPATVKEEPWTSEWDRPEDCHRQARSRSSSFFKSDLESIGESDSLEPRLGRCSLGGMGSDVSDTLQEEEDGEQSDGFEDGVDHAASGGHGFDLSDGIMEIVEETDEEEDDSDYVDEDEDLWEGWGDEEPATAIEPDAGVTTADFSGASSSAVIAAENKDNIKGNERVSSASTPSPPVSTSAITPGAAPLSTSAVVESNDSADALSRARPEFDAGGSRARTADGGGSFRTDCTGPSSLALSAEEQELRTDGVRLLWKALSRAQVAAAVLWRPAPKANRQDSHNERHFRTAMQRLQPPRWTEVNVRVYEDIYLWRDRTARRMDDGPAYVCPGDMLIDVALALPKSLDALRRVSAPLSRVLGSADTPEAVELVQLVRNVLGLPEEESL